MKIVDLPFGRDSIPTLLNERELGGAGVEIGVQRGLYSEILLADWNGKVLYSVDPWEKQSGRIYRDADNVEQDIQESFYIETRQRLAKFGNRSKILRMYSDEAVKRFPDHSLDFVYLDARHDYAGVSDDLAVWWGKVRDGGIIGGHDFIDKTTPDTDFGVKSAVLNFLTSVGHETVYQTEDTRQHTSWLAYKGGLV